MSLFQPSGLLTTSNNRRPITTAPLSAVACSRISASTASCCMTQVWELRRIAEPVLVIGALPGHKPVERHGDVGDHVRHCSLLSATVVNADGRMAPRLIAGRANRLAGTR